MLFRALTRFSGCHPKNVLYSLVRMSSKGFENIKDVDIDPDGIFKYILIKVYGGKKGSAPEKTIVRGYKRCAYHSDIYDEVTAKEFKPNKLEAECLGGGRIQHKPEEKKIKVYGYSQGFGKADHEISVAILQQLYTDYTITWTDEGY